jgi:Zn finger protein HypA/HybF involved in hydrogenase expression
MHELGLAAQIHRLCRRQLPPAARLHRVQLAVGELAAVEPELLRYAWEAMVGDGPDAGAALEIAWCAATQRCTSCGAVAERDAAEWKRECPGCGGTLAIEGGFELDVRGLDYTVERGAQG